MAGEFSVRFLQNCDVLEHIAKLLNTYKIFARNEITPQDYINRTMTTLDCISELWDGAIYGNATPSWSKRAREVLNQRTGVDL